MALRSFHSLGPIRRMVVAGWQRDAAYKLERIRPYLEAREQVLDIGSGFGLMSPLLEQEGHSVSGCDVVDSSVPPGHAPRLFDGSTLPYEDDAFSVALLLTVLHHTVDPDQLLREAARVARRVIVIEDVYESEAQRRITYFADSVFNLEFAGHPHSNRTHREWIDTFDRLELSVDAERSDRFLALFRQNTYALRRR